MEYISIKGVNAEPMTGVDAEKKGYRTNGNTGDGFEVTYMDGYKSWCPKDVFLRDAHEVKNAALANTCKMMVSSDYKERFRAEYIQLDNRINGLEKMLKAWSEGTLKFTPTCPKEWYEKEQLPAMKAYREVLNKRGIKEGIFTADDAD